MTDEEKPLRDIANELSRLGNSVTEGEFSADELRDRLWALSARLDPGNDRNDQVHRVAVVVFAEARAVDARDAASLTEMAIRSVLPRNQIVELPRRDGSSSLVRIANTMEIGMAAGNGYTWTQPTGQSWRYLPGKAWDGVTNE